LRELKIVPGSRDRSEASTAPHAACGAGFFIGWVREFAGGGGGTLMRGEALVRAAMRK